jgi:hypothetical protein
MRPSRAGALRSRPLDGSARKVLSRMTERCVPQCDQLYSSAVGDFRALVPFVCSKIAEVAVDAAPSNPAATAAFSRRIVLHQRSVVGGVSSAGRDGDSVAEVVRPRSIDTAGDIDASGRIHCHGREI